MMISSNSSSDRTLRRKRCCQYHYNDNDDYQKDVDNDYNISLPYCQQQRRQQKQNNKNTTTNIMIIMIVIVSCCISIMSNNTNILLFVHSFPIISTTIMPSHHRIITTTTITTSQNSMNHVWTHNNRRRTTTTKKTSSSSSLSRKSKSLTQLYMFYDVPEGFYTVTFFTLGILLNISKNFARIRMEENAWEQRLADSRLDKILKSDGTLTELDLRKQEAAYEYSAYGNKNNNNKYANDNMNRDNDDLIRERQNRKKKKVQVIDRDDDNDDIDDDDDIREEKNQSYRPMNDNEILFFEKQYRITYDPYYDEPYTIEELPDDVKYKVDKLYGDYIYENGEIFYKDTSYTPTIYWRQGSKPNSQRTTSSSSPIRFFPWMKK